MIDPKSLRIIDAMPIEVEEALEHFAVQVEQDVEMDLAQAENGPSGRPSVFALHCPQPLPLQNAVVFQRQWTATWLKLGVNPAPPLLILDRGIKIHALTEGDMNKLGYFKMVTESKAP